MTNKQPSTLLRVLLYLKHRKKTIVFLLVLITISQFASILVPFVSRTLIDTLTKFISHPGVLPWQTLSYCALGILGLSVISSMLHSNYNYHLFVMVTKVEDDLRSKAFEKYLQLHSLFHHSASSGQIIGRIERGGVSFYTIIFDLIGQAIIPPLIIFFGAFIALLYENVWVALAVLIPFPIYLLATHHIANKIYQTEQQSNDAFETISKELYDVAGNVLTVKKFSQEEIETKNHQRLMINAREI
ncbi:MAG: ABC transporter ATP-binding protein [Candidatus Falkowbacteria bacterium]